MFSQWYFWRFQPCLHLQGTRSLTLKMNTILRRVRNYPSKDMELTFGRPKLPDKSMSQETAFYLYSLKTHKFVMHAKEKSKKWQFKHTVLANWIWNITGPVNRARKAKVAQVSKNETFRSDQPLLLGTTSVINDVIEKTHCISRIYWLYLVVIEFHELKLVVS